MHDRERDLLQFLEGTPDGAEIHVIEARSVTIGQLVKTGDPDERKVHLEHALIRTKFGAMMVNSVAVDFDNIISWGPGRPTQSL